MVALAEIAAEVAAAAETVAVVGVKPHILDARSSIGSIQLIHSIGTFENKRAFIFC